jgi:hypothetical protein
LAAFFEGVLYDVATSRQGGGPAPSDRLKALINLAKAKGWIAHDIVDYAHVFETIATWFTPESSSPRLQP